MFKGRFILEYLFPVYGLLCYFTPGLDTRRRIITELRQMFRQSITEHRNTLDTNHPRSDPHLTSHISQLNITGI